MLCPRIRCVDSQCFNSSAPALTIRIKFRLKHNNSIATGRLVGGISSLESGTGSEALQSVLEICFKITTPLSGFECWRTKPIYIGRTATRIPAYLDFSYKEV